MCVHVSFITELFCLFFYVSIVNKYQYRESKAGGMLHMLCYKHSFLITITIILCCYKVKCAGVQQHDISKSLPLSSENGTFGDDLLSAVSLVSVP